MEESKFICRQKILVDEEKIKIETGVDRQTEQGQRVGRWGWDQELRGRMAVKAVAKDEKQGEYGKTWRQGKVKLNVTCWTALIFPVKGDVKSST